MDVLHGDCLDILPTLPRASFHACVTDPPYELAFMGRKWDQTGVAFRAETWRAVFDTLRPGAFLVAFGGTRTAHRMTCAIEDAGFEIRDTLCWLYGSGFPKSHNVSVAIDKMAGAVREVTGRAKGAGSSRTESLGVFQSEYDATAPATPEAALWAGWGTALKPAWENIILARKPLDGTVAANTLRHGCGGLNIDASRVGIDAGDSIHAKNPHTNGTIGANGIYGAGIPTMYAVPAGRWPANCVHDGSPEVEAAFAAFGEHKTTWVSPTHANNRSGEFLGELKHPGYQGFNDTGTASRFFYSAKATKHDRAGSSHPTIKPIALMQWLVRLVCPPGGHIIDPFAGSGTTGEAAARLGFDCTLIEREAAHIADIHHRLGRWHGADTPLFAEAAD